MFRFREQTRELDSGGYARLDVSDLLNVGEPEEEESALTRQRASSDLLCDWCRGQRNGGEYLVVADNRHYEVCTICWGRSPGYVELRQTGIPHETALKRLGAVAKAEGDGDDNGDDGG